MIIKNKNLSTYEDLLNFGRNNFRKAWETSRVYDGYLNRIYKEEQNYETHAKKIHDILSNDEFIGDKQIDKMIGVLQRYKTAMNNFRKFNESTPNINITGIEAHLTGVYYAQVLQLNNYIFTTSSTNYPNDVKFQPMFLGFYTKKSIAEKIFKHLINNKYNYYVYDECNKRCTMK